jgi:hypothetical protein
MPDRPSAGDQQRERSYFYTSHNVGLVVSHSPMAQCLRRIFFKSWESPYAEVVDPAGVYEPRRHTE